MKRFVFVARAQIDPFFIAPDFDGSDSRMLHQRCMRKVLVEHSGFEPLTSCMPCRRSTN